MAERIWALAPVIVFDAYIYSLSQPAMSSVKFVTDVVPTRSNSRFGEEFELFHNLHPRKSPIL